MDEIRELQGEDDGGLLLATLELPTDGTPATKPRVSNPLSPPT
jgi:hypothetical protein